MSTAAETTKERAALSVEPYWSLLREHDGAADFDGDGKPLAHPL
jgi:hypothetical protein